MRRALSTLFVTSTLCLSALAGAMPPPQEPASDSEAEPPSDAGETNEASETSEVPTPPPDAVNPTLVAAAKAAVDYEVVVSSEPMGQGDDRTARRLEGLLAQQAVPFGRCREQSLAAGEEPIRFFQLHVKLKNDGSFKKWETTSSTGSDAMDACVTQVVAGIVFDPPPMFSDKLEVNITWRKPKPPEPADE